MSTPMNFSTKFHVDGEPLSDPISYRRLIGRLIYLTNTRHNITYVFNHLSQYVFAPTKNCHQTTFRILRYLKGTVGLGILLDEKSGIHFIAYSDSDWAGYTNKHKSVTGYLVYLGNTIITWKSKKQTTISRSSFVAKYRALAHTTCEIQWLSHLMHDLNLLLRLWQVYQVAQVVTGKTGISFPKRLVYTK